MLIPGVSICSLGTARGHDLQVDGVLLSQLQSEIERKKLVPVKLNHRGGLETVIGWICNPRLAAGNRKLIGDLELVKSSPSYNFVRELVSKFSHSFGLSPAFSGSGETQRDGTTAARCADLHSIDLVESPASNPSGLFCRINENLIEFAVRRPQWQFPGVDDDETPHRSTLAHDAATGAVEGAGSAVVIDALLHGQGSIAKRLADVGRSLKTPHRQRTAEKSSHRWRYWRSFDRQRGPCRR